MKDGQREWPGTLLQEAYLFYLYFRLHKPQSKTTVLQVKLCNQVKLIFNKCDEFP